MSIIIAFIIFSVLILFHEYGHFLLARLNGMKVYEFSLGMGPRIISYKGKKTRYSFKLLPFGGSCDLGEDNEEDNDADSFNSKNVWQRLSVIISGPLFNFIMAFILSIILVGAFGYDKPVIDDVNKDYPAYEAGLKKGDIITSLDSKKIYLFREISLYNLTHPGKKVEVGYVRNNKTYTTTLTPKKTDEGYMFGISSSSSYTKPKWYQTFKYGLAEMRYWLKSAFESIKMLFTGKASLNDMTGVVGIYRIIGGTYTQAVKVGISTVIASMLNISILLSVSLGVMNLLPFPALDGGRIIFLLIEGITGKKVNQKIEGIIHTVGLILLIVLSIYIMFNDIFFFKF